MATPPFGPVLEAAVKHNTQGGKLRLMKGITISPEFFCCISGNAVGVAKDPVAHLVLDATRVCTGDPITATYSGSWSPSSTLNSWEVDWGDGNVSTGAWPGAGSVTHPGGGYTLPGTYTVTLTVTDLLGATGDQSISVEAIDCDFIPILLVAGCDASGVWGTETAGIAWNEIGGGTVDGVRVYDVKANHFTVGLKQVEVWIASEVGLYKGQYDTVNENASWQRLVLPEPLAGVGRPTAYALCPSRYDEQEFYVLARAADGTCWIYRTTDGGETWDSAGDGRPALELGSLTWEEVDGGADARLHDMIHDQQGNLYVCGEFTTIGGIAADHVARYDGQTWYPMDGLGTSIYDLDVTDLGTVYTLKATPDNLNIAVYYWDSGNEYWYALPTTTDGVAPNTIATNSMSIGVSPLDTTLIATCVRTIGGEANYIWDWASTNWSDLAVGNNSGVYSVKYEPSGNVAWLGGTMSTAPVFLRKYTVGDPSLVAVPVGQPDNGVFDISRDSATGAMYFVGAFHTIGGITAWCLAKYEDYRWSRPSAANWGSIANVRVYNRKEIYWGGSTGSIRKFDEDADATILLGTANLGTSAVCRYKGQVYAAGQFTSIDGVPINYLGRTIIDDPLGIQSDGLWHSMDMSADGQFVYVAGENSFGCPMVIRVNYDLEYFDVVWDEGNNGTWAGVACDPYFGNVVWVFGDMDTDDKVEVSEDWGMTWTNMTDASWGAGEVVRPLLISYWDTFDVVAVLNTALECWQTKDSGASWSQRGTTAFAAQCGARDPWEPDNLWIGRAAAGASHIQYSPNVGADWIEHSGGFTANAPVSGLVVIG